MHFSVIEKFSLIWLSGAVAYARTQSAIDPSRFAEADIITRDVCVIGGGSAGTYGVIRLKQLDQSVVVIEKKDRLGGHAHTYTDPATGRTADYGVQKIGDTPVARDYFSYLNIPLVAAGTSSQAPLFVDFNTGEEVDREAANNIVTAAFEKYDAQRAKYPFLDDGFNLPEPIPNDLLLRFGDFVEKHGLESAVSPIASGAFGFGNILHQPTLYVLKYYFRNEGSIFSNVLATEDGNTGALFEAAQAKLGADALLQSTVLQMERDPTQNTISIVVQTPSGKKLISARKLLVAIPPKLDNLAGFDLCDNETSLFRQFKNTHVFTTLLNNTGLADGPPLLNASPKTRYNLPSLPGPHWSYPATIPGLTQLFYESTDPIPPETVKSNIIKDIRTLRRAAEILPVAPDFLAFEDHSPYLLTVSPRAIVGGFYSDLNALQGQRNTYYTGAAFQTHNSAMIWNFTEGIVQKMIES